ncbi:MAG TPA: efflux RND transporter permease subunit [Phycisphaerae bacterium]|nr:efflux RND transporter permease subunit [Phycisphaerae bacterium]HPS52397.1 efflux RND transporter permease subunit [Phycisphaerae bacterium]
MNLATLAIKNKTVTMVWTILICVGGIIAYLHLGRLENPTFTIKTALVSTTYPGASADEVQQQVTDPLEKAIQQMGQIDKIRSLSQRNLSIIYVDIKDEYNHLRLPQVWDELRRKVNDAQSSLPSGAGPSVVNDDFGDVYGVFFALTGEGYDLHDLKEFADDLRRDILQLVDAGVAKVDMWGVPREIIYIEFKRSVMSQLGVSPEEIASLLKSQDIVAPSGQVTIGPRYIRIEPTGKFNDIETIGDLILRGKTNSDSIVKLKDVIEIKREYEDPRQSIMYYNGQPAIGIGISTVDGGNVITMGKAVKKKIAQIKGLTPIGMQLHIVSYQSDTVDEAVNGFVINLVEAVVIVIALLLVFMGIHTGLLIGIILLLTILSTFILMWLFNIDLQQISLGALIIALGMLVDNAIVVAEGILVRVQKGEKRLFAAEETVHETAYPLMLATFVAILAFAAISLNQSNVGEYCRSLFYVIAISLGMSWILAVTSTPLLSTMFLKPPAKEIHDPYAGRFYQTYRRFLVWCLHHRIKVCIVMALLLLSSIYGFRFVQKSFFPDSTRPQFFVDIWCPQGTHINTTAAITKELDEFIRKQPGVTDVGCFIGKGALRFILPYDMEMPNSSYAQLLVNVDDYQKIDACLKAINDKIAKEPFDANIYAHKFHNGPGNKFKIVARFRGPDTGVLRSLAEKAKDIMRADRTPDSRISTRDVRDNWRQKTMVMHPRFLASRARQIGATVSDLRSALQNTYGGTLIGAYREDNDLLGIMARPVESDRKGIDQLQNQLIWCSAVRQFVPLGQLIDGIGMTWDDDILWRWNRQLAIEAQCNATVETANTVYERLRKKIEQIPLPLGYELEWGGDQDSSSKAQAPIAKTFPLCLLAMFLLVLMLFNSLRPPIIIFMCLPLAIIGVTGSLLVLHKSFGFMAILGFLSLSGMLIKNAIILIDQIRIDESKGSSTYNALLMAGVSRIRPVMMASMTTVLGMVPLISDPMFDAMAVTIMGGLTFGTLLTLVFVPVLYSVFYRVHPD